MAVKKGPEFKHIGQVGHFKIAQKQERKGNVISATEIVVLNGRKVVASGFKSYADALSKGNELMSEHKKIRKNKV